MSDQPVDDPGFTAAPVRYTAHGRETIDRMRDLARETFADPDEADAAFAFFCRATALKYDDRAGLKGCADTDRQKAAWYRQMADHVDGVGDDPRQGRAGFVPYTEGGKLAVPVALATEWEVEPGIFGRSRHMLCAAGDSENVVLMLEVRPGREHPGRVEWHCSPPAKEFLDRCFESGTIPAPVGEIDAAIAEAKRFAHEAYDRWSREQMARNAASPLAVSHG